LLTNIVDKLVNRWKFISIPIYISSFYFLFKRLIIYLRYDNKRGEIYVRSFVRKITLIIIFYFIWTLFCRRNAIELSYFSNISLPWFKNSLRNISINFFWIFSYLYKLRCSWGRNSRSTKKRLCYWSRNCWRFRFRL
jgi:hypothetical protein